MPIPRFAAALAFSFWASAAHANGAFPDSGQLLVSPERPDEMVIGTNFGLILSEDAGASWEWVCEGPETTMGRLYQIGEGGRLYAISATGLVYSDDRACTWAHAGGALATVTATDVFVDPTRPRHLLVAAAGPDGSFGLHASSDAGLTFGDALLTSGTDEVFTSIESSRSSPDVLYVASSSTTFGEDPRLHRSEDGGQTWNSTGIPVSSPSDLARIILVDPVDPDTLLLRISPAYSGDTLVLTRDGGATFRTVAALEGRFTAFVRREDGTFLVAGEVNQAGVGFRSDDHGETFTPWAVAPRLRALAEHQGALLAATSDALDGYSLAASTDDGATWQARARYGEVRRIKACAASSCQGTCQAQAVLSVWPASVCSPEGNTSTADDSGYPGARATDGGFGASAAREPREVGCAVSTSRAFHGSPHGPARSAVRTGLLVLLGCIAGARLRRNQER